MKLLFTCFLIIFSFSTFAQHSKAKEYFDKAIKNLSERKNNEAFENFAKAIEKDSAFAEAYFKLGQLNEMARNHDKTTFLYNKTILLKPNEPAFVQAYSYLGSRALRAGEYAKAKEYLEFSLKTIPPNSPIIKQLNRQIENCQFGIDAQKKPANIQPTPLDKTVNFSQNQYFPVLTADNETLIFTARQKDGDENLYFSKFQHNAWTQPQSLSPKINSPANEGTASISADGRTLVFTSCDSRNSFGSCDLYISKKVGEEWSEPKNLGLMVNSPYWEAQPSLSNDGRKLYFSSDRSTGFGRKDLWMSELNENGIWTKAINLGKEINTQYDEVSPFIHANNRTFFFASDGHTGLGGLDLFMTESKAGTFSKPENLGFPINTQDDQVAFFITADGKKAYYSLDLKNATKLYYFEIPQEISEKFKKVNFVKGKITDAQNQQALQAEIELIELSKNELVQRIKSDSLTGDYVAVIPNGGNYGLFVQKKGFFNKSLSFDYVEKSETEGKKIDISLQKIEIIKENIRLENIFFDINKADLKPESMAELSKLLKIMNENPSIAIEIHGHTDDIGKDMDNQVLSQKRAESVMNFLLAQNIPSSRLKAVGFGESRPIYANTSEENRQLNRRIEIMIIKN
jgi:outer membrane protein OmpA-like peptidoglycan-associated protein